MLASAAYWGLRQDAYWSDGRSLIEQLGGGRWGHDHLLYFPVAQGLARLVEPLGLGPEGTLELFSAAATGLAVGLFVALLRAPEARRSRSPGASSRARRPRCRGS